MTLEEIVRRVCILTHLNPYEMWEKNSPRQVYQLVLTHRALNSTKDADVDVDAKDKKNETIDGVPKWYPAKKGTKVFSLEDLTQGDI